MTTSASRTTDRSGRGAAGWLVALCLIVSTAAADDERLAKGEYLLHAGGCVTCHTADDGGAPLAGGRAIESPFGVFYSPNITPDRETGIGGWTDDEFLRAFWDGVRPDGEHYFPAFPYTSYTGIRREDLLAIKAWLFSLPPVHQQNRDHELTPVIASRFAAGLWKSRYFESHRFEPDPTKDEQWNRGAYLVRHLGHCGECHTPRNSWGALDAEKELAGNPDFGEDSGVPDITPDRDDGIGRWSASDIDYFLETGMLPDGDFTGGSMGAVIEDNTSHLTREDRRAMAAYLRSLPAQ